MAVLCSSLDFLGHAFLSWSGPQWFVGNVRVVWLTRSLPANVRVEKERALQSAQYELAETQKARKKSDMIGKYHKIRFFDRQKATKKLKRLRKDVEACEDEDQKRSELVKVADAEVDVNYAIYYPLELPYVSLFPRKQNEGDGDGKHCVRQ